MFITTKDYITKFKGYDITVPKGSKATNMTAIGVDDNYRFWIDYQKVAKKLTGFADSILAHDLKHYGLNIPKECFRLD